MSTSNNNGNRNVGRFSGHLLNFINQINQNELRNRNSLPITRSIEDKILPNSPIISKEDPNIVIYQYPDIKFSKNISENCKIIFVFGTKKEAFIKSFVNIYRDIAFEDKFRYEIKYPTSNDAFQIYDIKARTFKYNLKLICFPDFSQNKNDSLTSDKMLELLNLFKENIIPNKMHYILITLEEGKKLVNHEITFFYLFTKFFNIENIKDKIIIMHNTNKFNENHQNNINIINSIFNYEKDDFLFDENYDTYFSSLFNPEFNFINTNILYDKKCKEEYEKLSEKIKIIDSKFKQSKKIEIDTNKMNLIYDIIKSNDLNKINRIISELEKYERKEAIILFYFLIYGNIKNNLTAYIVNLYKKINNPGCLNLCEINFVKDKFFKRNFILYSKIIYTYLEKINGVKCEFDDSTLAQVENIFTSKLICLNLSNNKLSDISIFGKKSFSSLKNLDISYNNISNLDAFKIYKWKNLKTLNLSYNNISDIKAFTNDDSSNFLNLTDLNLSNNKIKKLNKINIKSLQNINLLNNELSEGIKEFLNYNFFNSKQLEIDNNQDSLNFYFSINCTINFGYLVQENNISNLLNNLSFKGINSLQLYNFEKFDFLANDSFSSLTYLNLENSSIDDITIFNKVKFIDIKEINLGYNEIINGYNSLHAFKSIKGIYLKAYYDRNSNQYDCEIKFDKPIMTLNYHFKDLYFLKDNLLNENMEIYISQEIFDYNQNFFTFSAIKNSFRLFKNLKANKVDINYISSLNKYECYGGFNRNIKLKFLYDDLLFLKDNIFEDIYSIKINNGFLSDALDLSLVRFPKLNNIELNNNKIESLKIFNDIYAINNINEENKKFNELNNEKKTLINITINSNICNSNLVGQLLGDKFNLNFIGVKNGQIKLSYTKPFNFEVLVDKIKLNNIRQFSNCSTIDLREMEFSSDDLNFLKNNSLFYLRYLYLNLSESVNLNFLDTIGSKYIYEIKIKNKFKENHFNYLNNNGFYCDDLIAKIDEKENNYLKIKFTYKKNYKLFFEYSYEINKNLILLKNLNLYKIVELNLSNINLNNIDFLINRTLNNLKILNLDSNKIEDISIFTKEQLNFSLYKLNLKNNPIRKGIQVFNNEFFKRSIYMELNITKNENEFKICPNYKFPFYDIEFYINSINDVLNIFDFKNEYIKFINSNNVGEAKLIEDMIKSYEIIDNKGTIFEIILFILNLRRKNGYDSINIKYEKNSTIFGRDENLYINDNNRILFEKAFKCILDKKPYYQDFAFKIDDTIYKYVPYFTNFNLFNLNSIHENLIVNFPYTEIYNLTMINCNFNLNIFEKTKFSSLKKIDLSQSKIIDISGICGNIPFTNLKILDLSHNTSITNLSELKNARFNYLEELNLSNDNINDLNEIKLGEYPFYRLTKLNLSHNHITSLEPIKYFRNLKIIDLEYNNINNNDEYNYIIDLNQTIQIRNVGNPASGSNLGMFCMKII